MATVRQYRGRYVADFRDQHGRRRIEAPNGPFENRALEKRAAQELLSQRTTEVKHGTFVQVSEKLTFAEVCNRFLKSRTEAHAFTIAEYRQLVDDYLIPYFGHRRAETVGMYHVEMFRDELRAGLPDSIRLARERKNQARKAADPAARLRWLKPGARTVNKLLTLLSMMGTYGVNHGWIPRNPAAGVGKLTQPKGESRVIEQNVLGPDELRRVVDHAVDPYRMPIAFAVYTGARQSEVLGLRWSDIDWNKNEAHIRRRFRLGGFSEPKTETSRRVVELPAELVRDLRVWKLKCPKAESGQPEHDVCFPAPGGGPMAGTSLNTRGFVAALRRAGIRRVRYHDLRHAFASNLIAAGVDVVTVSRLLGHASPQITMSIYSHVIPKERHGASELLARLMRESGNKTETASGSDRVSGGSDDPKPLFVLEASAGIEPAYTDLQSAA